MKSYLYLNQDSKGKIAVSSYVFSQIATQTLLDLVKGSMKDCFIFDEKNKKTFVDSVVDTQGKLTISVSIIGITGKDMQKVSSSIQQEIYDNINEMFEIGKVNVNITILGMQEQK